MRFITLIKRTYWLSPAQTHIDLAPIWPKHWNKWHSCSSGREGTHWYLKGCTRSSHVYGKFEWNNLALCWIEKVSYVSSITLFTSYSLLSSSCSLPLLIGYQLSYDAAQNHQIEISESKQWREGLMAWIDPERFNRGIVTVRIDTEKAFSQSDLKTFAHLEFFLMKKRLLFKYTRTDMLGFYLTSLVKVIQAN